MWVEVKLCHGQVLLRGWTKMSNLATPNGNTLKRTVAELIVKYFFF